MSARLKMPSLRSPASRRTRRHKPFTPKLEALEARTTPVCVGPITTCFLNQAYLDLLGRPVDPGGLAGWTDALNRGVSRTQVVLGITQSQEYRALAVQQTFVTFLRRQAEPAALAFFTAFITTASIEQMQSLVLGSAEYIAVRGGGTPLGFLNALFLDVLGRPVDPAAAQAFSQALALGVPPPNIALTVITSTEGATILVDSLYRQFLRRPADSTGLIAFVTALQSGSRREQVIAIIVGSDEYLARL